MVSKAMDQCWMIRIGVTGHTAGLVMATTGLVMATIGLVHVLGLVKYDLSLPSQLVNSTLSTYNLKLPFGNPKDWG